MTATCPPRCRRCGSAHRTWHKLASCRFRALWVSGNDRFASVSFCPRGTTVQMYATRPEAEAAKAAIDTGNCGGACIRHHKVIDLAPEGRGGQG